MPAAALLAGWLGDPGLALGQSGLAWPRSTPLLRATAAPRRESLRFAPRDPVQDGATLTKSCQCHHSLCCPKLYFASFLAPFAFRRPIYKPKYQGCNFPGCNSQLTQCILVNIVVSLDCCLVQLVCICSSRWLIVASKQPRWPLVEQIVEQGYGYDSRAIIEHQPTLKSYLDNTQNSQPKGTPFALLTFC